MAVEKMTKKQKFEMLKGLVKDNQMLVEFIDHEIELLEKKKSSGKGKATEKTDKEMELVFNALAVEEKAVTVSELIAKNGFDELANAETGVVSSQKVSAVLKKLVDGGKVVKFSEKKKTYFRVAEETDSE